ncbi:FadR/GntR family transcriptional regulator [Oceanidesulfovibrio marinus]|uniref:FadR family transcriptional regulator n=1 Tax=Oceanidesulfovibrio marinus TaxID=370038 RepID=A0ABX6NL13_9BACT|nr:GntR family transcriptional regulator [Oceanidesulfovibrio marinus]QJT10809.1 FadR family transcriptional regulator [Oceanidesulfovibrio marinus]
MATIHTHALFMPAKSGRSSEDVALQIEAAILAGKILPGESLPSEREMQHQFQVSRGAVREALRALKEKGMLDIRKGAKGGAFVKEVEVSNVSASLALFLKQHPIAPEQLIEFRENLDRTVTMLAIARSSKGDREKLLDGAHKLQDAAEEPDLDMEMLGEMDRELNLLLGRMSHNPIFEWVMGALQQGFSSHDYALYEDPDFRRQTVDNWVETARQIAAGEPLLALSSISNHYVLLRRCVERRAGDAGAAETVRGTSPDQ